MIYRMIGKFVVQQGVRFVRRRYGERIVYVVGFTAVAVTVGFVLSRRQVQEG